MYEAGHGGNCGVLRNCRNLERVSIKNATWSWIKGEHEPLTQGMLVNFVRLHSTLRRLCSNLTEESVAMLNQERPKITFVSK